uniref:Uncharacterized protein n=1 Tax=Bionectria ochroleuca TaxID=29856 RepID=A0A8H7TJ73_BIOOC
MLRDNQQTPEPQAQPSIETAAPAPVQEEQTDAVSPISPIEEDATKAAQAPDAEVSKSQFTQGPLEDQPAFVPESDDENDATPPPLHAAPSLLVNPPLKSTLPACPRKRN